MCEVCDVGANSGMEWILSRRGDVTGVFEFRISEMSDELFEVGIGVRFLPLRGRGRR
jgi:hypothetical protein